MKYPKGIGTIIAGRLLPAIVCAFAWASAASAQGMGSDFLGGKLIDPEVGQWAWYDLEDAQTKSKFAVRQAIVAQEKVGSRDGYWLEIEIVPEVGYKILIKMLMTGPDYDLESMKKMIFKNGLDPAQEVKPDPQTAKEVQPKANRKLVGTERVDTGSGEMAAERFQLTEGNRQSTLWINHKVLPTGIVRMESPNGNWRLRSYGIGGKNAESLLDSSKAQSGDNPNVRVEVQEGEVR